MLTPSQLFERHSRLRCPPPAEPTPGSPTGDSPEETSTTPYMSKAVRRRTLGLDEDPAFCLEWRSTDLLSFSAQVRFPYGMVFACLTGYANSEIVTRSRRKSTSLMRDLLRPRPRRFLNQSEAFFVPPFASLMSFYLSV